MVIDNDGRQASRWYRENLLQGNPSKYLAMITSNDSTQRGVQIDNFIVRPMEKLKILGVLFDRNLLFSNHISTVCKKAGMRVSILMRMRNMISMRVKLRIYKAAALPYLIYCSLVWHFCRGSDQRKLERANERGLRAVFCDWKSSYGELLARARMTSLYNRRL